MYRFGLQRPNFVPILYSVREVLRFIRWLLRQEAVVVMIYTLNMTIPSMSPGSLRPSGLAESPLLLIGLAERLFVDVELFKRVDDLSRCGMIRTIFTGSRNRVDGPEPRYRLGSQRENGG